LRKVDRVEDLQTIEGQVKLEYSKKNSERVLLTNQLNEE